MKKIDGALFKNMIISGANNLYNNYPEIDSLNVFPVPDGDTGTNMNLTMQSGINEVFNGKAKKIGEVAKDFAKGLLMGARGNSGVILSQIFCGFSDAIADKDEIDAVELAEAFIVGKDVAYKAVIRPVEGTILTVIRESSAVLYERVEHGMQMSEVMDIFYSEALKSLEHTPELLPILKEVGVIDSGGAGLCKILEGFSKALHNKIVEKEMATVTENTIPYTSAKPSVVIPDHGNVQAKFNHEEFGYCTQFLLRLQDPSNLKDKKAFNDKRFKAVLEAHGNSIVFIHLDDLVKVHIHTMKPGIIFNYAQQFGEFKTMKCDNMTEQHEDLLDDFASNNGSDDIIKHDVALKAAATVPQEKKKYALISVSVGKGIEKMFKDCSVDVVVSGGQTMNPSTADFVSAIKSVNADHIFIFPNNSNILLAAQQAADMVKDKQDVIVVPTKTIPEGLVACMMFSPDADKETNVEEMTENIKSIVSAEVTYAVRDTKIDGVAVKEGNYIAISNKKLICTNKDKFKTLYELIEKIIKDDYSMITVIAGEDVTEDEINKINVTLTEKYGEDFDIAVEKGGQPVYSFYISVE